jgi:hypothetical protein
MTTITIDKTNYVRAVNVAPNPLYGGLLTNTLGNDASQENAVTFAFDAPYDADYLLEVDYASSQNRPVMIYFNGALVSRNALVGQTSSWTSLERAGVSRVHVTKGQNLLIIQRKGAIPHLGNISLMRL